MKATWFIRNPEFDHYILAGDIGGTNTNLAVVGKNASGYSLVLVCSFSSSSHSDLEGPVSQTLKEAGPSLAPVKCCIAAAGPIKNNYCQLTNQNWGIDGKELAAHLQIPVILVNDFLGLSYGIPLLDTANPDSITCIPASDGTYPEKHGHTCAIIGAGTGLGVGCVTEDNGRVFAIPSEGGHIDFAPFDEETTDLVRYFREKNRAFPDAEALVSGQGINNIFDFYCDCIFENCDDFVKSVLDKPRIERPGIIGSAVAKSAQCRSVMELFIKCYAKTASNIALAYMSEGGVFIAGGIVTKNENLFLENNLFISSFIRHMRPAFSKLLRGFPVFIVRDYYTSLLGAAHAGDLLL